MSATGKNPNATNFVNRSRDVSMGYLFSIDCVAFGLLAAFNRCSDAGDPCRHCSTDSSADHACSRNNITSLQEISLKKSAQISSVPEGLRAFQGLDHQLAL